MPVRKPQVHSIQKKNHPPPVRQIFEVRASRHRADRLSPATVPIPVPAYSWEEIQSHGEFLTLMFIRYLESCIHPWDKSNTGMAWGACSAQDIPQALEMSL